MLSLRNVFWVVLVAGLAVYIAMVTWTLPTIIQAAGGSRPFDLRPGGYSLAQAREFLSALGPEGRAMYVGPQRMLDLVYPPLITATLALGIALLTPDRWRRWRWHMASVALPIVVFDYLENAAVARMLELGADGVTEELVASASRWTVLKSGFSTVAMTWLLLLAAAWGWRRLGKPRSA